MVSPEEMEKATGYVKGGCSPFGMRKAMPLYVHEAAAALPASSSRRASGASSSRWRGRRSSRPRERPPPTWSRNRGNEMPHVITLEGKVALVTGASQGIGEAVARRLAAAGATVLVAARNEEKAAAVAASIAEAGGAAESVRLDVSDPASVTAAFKGIVERHGKLDVLVNNAGITDDGLLLRMSKESWDRVIATDLTGVFLVSQEAVKLMMKKRVAGRIITVGSVVGLMGNPGQANYAAAKAGVGRLHDVPGREIGSRGSP
jgi:3-oxoacyl-[acyl-carrier-protein] reductase (EC 1.1.1.100)